MIAKVKFTLISNPSLQQPRLAPEGDYLAFLKPLNDHYNLFIKAPLQGEEIPLTSFSDQDIQEYEWQDRETIVFSQDKNGDHLYHLYRLNIHSKETVNLTPEAQGQTYWLKNPFPSASAHSNEITYLSHHLNSGQFNVYRVNIKTLKTKLILDNKEGLSGFILDHNGRLRLAQKIHANHTEILYRPGESTPFKNILTYDLKQKFIPLMFTPDNLNILALSQIDHDKATMVEFDPRRKKVTRIIYQHPNRDLTPNIIYSAKQKKIMAINIIDWKNEYAFFDAEMENLFDRLSEKEGQSHIELLNFNKSEDQFLFSVQSDQKPTKYYLYANNDFNFVGEEFPNLNNISLSSTRPIQLQSRDGRTLYGYVTLPSKLIPQQLPFIIFIHDAKLSPDSAFWGRDSWEYNPVVQWATLLGYGVLQINYRGSSGYGKRFSNLAHRQWGSGIQNDISDGYDWLIKQGLAHPKKVALMGQGFGGYLALMSAIKEPQNYACVLSLSGITNWVSFLKNLNPYQKLFQDRWYALVGHPKKDLDYLKKISPSSISQKINLPVFLAHGKNNPMISFEESQQLYKLLQGRVSDLTYLLKEEEGEFFSKEENRKELFSAMERTLKNCVKK
ncbi:MAG: prolyl oligopeptidase family serine peptidase [Bdellovibrionales bacterium]|nr:prolyl oligopeptidase family serine peptidase [Bdellovibrionales bacterium]